MNESMQSPAPVFAQASQQPSPQDPTVQAPAAPDAAQAPASEAAVPDAVPGDAAAPAPSGAEPAQTAQPDGAAPDAAVQAPGGSMQPAQPDGTVPLQGEELPAPDAPAVDAPEVVPDTGGDLIGGLWSSLTDALDLGGPVVALLLLLSVFALAVILVKLWQFLKLRRTSHGRIARAVTLWVNKDYEAALAAMALPKTPVARVVALAMRASLSGRSEGYIREEVESAALEEVAALRSYFRALEAVAQVAPLLGLFGTVLGMIEAFQALEASGVRVNPADLAGGIWVALLTTAVGLAIAMPVSLVLYAFESRVDRERRAMEAFSTAVLTNPPDASVAVQPKTPRERAGASRAPEPGAMAGAAHAR